MASQHFYMLTPGARLDVGRTGTLYETMSGCQEECIVAKSNDDARVAAAEPDAGLAAKKSLGRMKRSLKGYLAMRKKLTDLMSGKRKGKISAARARATIDLDPEGEQKLADDLYNLLSQVHDPANLPLPSPETVVALSTIAIKGEVGQAADKPVAQGIIPILIVAGAAVLLLTFTSFISNRADVQKEKLRIECEKAGECSRTSDLIVKIGVVGLIGWFAWEKMGLKQKFNKPTRRRRR